MRVAAILVAIILVTMTSRADSPATTQASEAYQLVWADEFDHDGPLDAKDWQNESGFVRNRELQWYQAENAFCKDGYLIIEARRETKLRDLSQLKALGVTTGWAAPYVLLDGRRTPEQLQLWAPNL